MNWLINFHAAFRLPAELLTRGKSHRERGRSEGKGAAVVPERSAALSRAEVSKGRPGSLGEAKMEKLVLM